MATYYSSWKTHTSGIKARLKIVTSSSQNVEDNTSKVTVREYVQVSGIYENWCGSYNHVVKISGTSYSSSGQVEHASNGTRLIQTRTKTISHNVYGEGSFTVSGSCKIFNGVTLSIGTKELSLPTINRASSITSNATSSAGKQFGDSITFKISRYNSTFTHKLTYSSGGTTYTIGEDIGTSKSYSFPIDLIQNYPNAVKNGITVTCTTYKDSRKIGSSKSTTVYLNVPESYTPTCSLALAEVNEKMLSLGWGVYVKGRSQINGVITAEGSGGSTIKKYSTTGNRETFSTNNFVTGLLIESAEALTFKTSISDSRGRTASASQSVNVLDYIQPTIYNVQIDRCLEDGTLNDEGEYGKATIKYNITPIENLNAKSIRVTYGDVVKTATLDSYTGTYTLEDLFEGLETNGTYTFTFELIDSFENVTQECTLPPAFVTRSFLAGGKGISVGQIATEEGLHSHMDTYVHKNTWVKNVSISGLKTEKLENGGWICYAEDEA